MDGTSGAQEAFARLCQLHPCRQTPRAAAGRDRPVPVGRRLPRHVVPPGRALALNEAGCLPKLARVSNVSGGSIVVADFPCPRAGGG